MIRLGMIAAMIFFSVSVACGDDWPQWMGVNRDGVWNEKNTISEFPKGGLKPAWKLPIAGGYAGPAVSQGKVFVTDFVIKEGAVKNDPSTRGKLKGHERLMCVDEKTGAVIWEKKYDCVYDVSYPCGPRCTPTVDGDRVYSVGTMGHLKCWSVKNGELLWSKSFVDDYKADTPIWGFSGHPYVHGDSLICLVGGKNALLVAFDKKTGKELWKNLNAKEPGYSSPRVLKIGGSEQLIIWFPNEIAGLDPASGKRLWSHGLEPKYGMSIMAPLPHGEHLFAGGIGNAAVDLKVTEQGVKPAWVGARETALYPVNMTPIIHNDVMYGCDQPGAFRAVDLKTGQRLWSSMLPVTGKDVAETNVGSGTAFVVRNGEKYFLFAETGHLIIAKLTPEKYEELSRTLILQPTGEAFGRKVVWSHPAFANGHIFARNDKELVCYSLVQK